VRGRLVSRPPPETGEPLSHSPSSTVPPAIEQA
jgi:hypothetical protein